jgi:hypothetical protein
VELTVSQIQAGISAYENVTGERLPDADGKDVKIVTAIFKAILGDKQ